MNIKNELMALVRAFDSASVPYALCGGMAMAAHGWPVPPWILISWLKKENGKRPSKQPGASDSAMNRETRILGGAVFTPCGWSRLPGEDYITLDLIIADQGMGEAWASRKKITAENGPVCVVSRQGLIAMI